MKNTFIFLVMTFCVFSHSCHKKLWAETKNVFVNINPPFCYMMDDKLVGIDIDILDSIGDENKWEFNYVVADNVGDALDAVKNKKADIAIGGITITPERERFVDFTHPTYDWGGIQLMVNKKYTTVGFMSRFQIVLKLLLTITLVAFVCMTICAHLMWFFEKENGDEVNFSSNYFKGIGQAYWWTIVTASTVGYGDVTPKLWVGRLIAILVIVAGIMSFSLMTGSISSALTVLQQAERTIALSTLDAPIGTKQASTSHRFLVENKGIEPVLYNVSNGGIDQACKDVANGKLGGVVFDYPSLKRFSNNNSNCVLSGERLTQEKYGYVVNDNNIREQLNQSILQYQFDGRYTRFLEKWMK